MKRHRGGGGFSLVELIVSVTVFSAMLAAFFVFYRSQALALAQQERSLNAKQNAQIGIDFLARELRTAGSRPLPESFTGCGVAASTATVCFGLGGVKGFPGLVDANATSLRLLADYRGDAFASAPDGCPDDADEDVTYTYSSGTGRLLRTPVGGTPTSVIEGIAPNGISLLYFGYGTGSPPPYVEFTGNLTANQIAQLTHIVITVTTRATSVIVGVPEILSTQTSTIDVRNPAC